jgi:hypothetical protein
MNSVKTILAYLSKHSDKLTPEEFESVLKNLNCDLLLDKGIHINTDTTPPQVYHTKLMVDLSVTDESKLDEIYSSVVNDYFGGAEKYAEFIHAYSLVKAGMFSHVKDSTFRYGSPDYHELLIKNLFYVVNGTYPKYDKVEKILNEYGIHDSYFKTNRIPELRNISLQLYVNKKLVIKGLSEKQLEHFISIIKVIEEKVS